MASIEIISSLLQSNNILLFILLIIVFVIAYQILRAVIEIGLIAVTSGIFFAVISYLGMGPAITVSNILGFMALGVILYLAYSSISAISSLIGSLWDGVKSLFSSLTSSSSTDKSTSTTTEKKVILKEVSDDE